MDKDKLEVFYTKNLVEAGIDEVGVGCLAGPIVAAAVVLPKDFRVSEIRDSKKLSSKKRKYLSEIIKEKAISHAIGICSNEEVDRFNCKKAAFLAMHRAIDNLEVRPELLLIDGHLYRPHDFIPYSCIVKGDSKFLSIAAASILAKVFRDELMLEMDILHPKYNWKRNVGYPTKEHIAAIQELGVTDLHRRSFGVCKLAN